MTPTVFLAGVLAVTFVLCLVGAALCWWARRHREARMWDKSLPTDPDALRDLARVIGRTKPHPTLRDWLRAAP